MHEPVLTIITVCYQAKDAVRSTIENILKQTWKQFEYLIIDGASSDGTSTLLEQYIPVFSKAGIHFRFTSEPDHGIYDAMNKGTSLSHGKWLLFLNAGDLFADEHVLEQIFHTNPSAQILYGDTLCIYQGNTRRYPAQPLSHLEYEMAFCHQSAFMRRELLLEHPYDLSYKVCADHEFFLSMYLQKKSFEYFPCLISVYEIAGYSDKNKFLAHKEKHRMQKELGIFRFSFSWFFREIIFYLKQGVKQLFGQKLIDLIRKNRLH